jgi:GT2 family glycosyltransferase
MKIAVLLTTFNRVQKTVACLESLYSQNLDDKITIDVFLTDDASSDRTKETVNKLFPAIRVFEGTGSLFWAGGMRNSWAEAIKTNPDYYLLLNDDTILESSAIRRLIKCCQAQKNNDAAICIGSTRDSATGKLTYGGQVLYKRGNVKSYPVYSESDCIECDMGNANIMLVSNLVVNKIGILSEEYTHSIADFDYTLRAKKAGFKVIVVAGTLGFCTDDHGNNWQSANVPLAKRIQYLKSPKGLAYKEYMHFIKLHFPFHRPAAFLKLWAKTLFPVLWDKFKT